MIYSGIRTLKGIEVDRLDGSGLRTPLPAKLSQALCNHSPDGFEWGYGGSGPAQLALAILLDVTSDPKESLRFYQQFKWAFVSHWGNTWTIRDDVIRRWIENARAADDRDWQEAGGW